MIVGRYPRSLALTMLWSSVLLCAAGKEEPQADHAENAGQPHPFPIRYKLAKASYNPDGRK